MLKNSLFQPSLSFSFSAAVLFLFLFLPFLFQRCPLLFLYLSAFLFFSIHVCPFFQPKKHSFQPKTILSSTQKHFFQPKRFCPNVFQFFLAQTLLQPKTFFSSAHTTVSASFCFVSAFFLFVGSVFSAPFLFVQRLLFYLLFQRLILFFLPISKAKNILFRCFTFLLFE